LPFYDQFGAGGRLAVSKQVIMRTRVTERLHAMVDAGPGGTSLADNEDYRLVAEALQDLDAVQAAILEQKGWALSPSDGSIFTEPLQQGGGPFLRPYSVFATGSAYVDRDEAQAILVLVHEDKTDAEENARLLPERISPASEALVALVEARPDGSRPDPDPPDWSEHITELDVDVHGRVLLATVRGDEELQGAVADGRGWFGDFLRLLLAWE
jgi:hypothetical protein